MTDECLNINDHILAYANKTIDVESNKILIKHLSICPKCREELAWILSLSQITLEEFKEVPEDIMKNAFMMISGEGNNKSKTSLDDLKSTLVILRDVLSTTKKSIRLAIQFI